MEFTHFTHLAVRSMSEYLVLRFDYTTADIEKNTFCGETPDPVHFAMPEPPVELEPMVLTVIMVNCGLSRMSLLSVHDCRTTIRIFLNWLKERRHYD